MLLCGFGIFFYLWAVSIRTLRGCKRTQEPQYVVTVACCTVKYSFATLPSPATLWHACNCDALCA